jgi:multimeric flavodoxin WrbA
MKVLAVNGSPRKDGNTEAMLMKLFEELNQAGIETEIVQVGGHLLAGCRACNVCGKRKDNRCVIKDDIVNELLQKMIAADGIILGSPTYFADVTTEMKAIIDRAGKVSRANGNLLRRKVGAAVVAKRRGGSIHAFDTMNHWFQVGEMIIVGSTYWNMGIGGEKQAVLEDQEGMETMANLGKNMAWLLGKLA